MLDEKIDDKQQQETAENPVGGGLCFVACVEGPFERFWQEHDEQYAEHDACTEGYEHMQPVVVPFNEERNPGCQDGDDEDDRSEERDRVGLIHDSANAFFYILLVGS